MALVSLQNATLKFNGVYILDNVNFLLEKGQRVCLLGRNGTGKTSMLRCLVGELKLDSGNVQISNGVKIAYFSQNIPENRDGTVFELVAEKTGKNYLDIIAYHKAELEINDGNSEAFINFDNLRLKLDETDAWNSLDEIYKSISNVGLKPEMNYSTLSGGQKRRAILAAALVNKPEVLLLDEPTNHLDIETITWLEDFLLRLNIAIVFVTHDRMLLRRLATRIAELDRGKLYDWECDYDTFLSRKADVLAAEDKEWEKFDKKLAAEEVWIRKGIQARRTRNEGRVRALKKMREERKLRRNRIGKTNMAIMEASKSGYDVITAENICFSYDKKPIIKDFSLKVVRGDKIGIIGKNGCGKSTLVKLLLGYLKPQSGCVEHGTNLEVIYFDQLRNQLDETKTVWENVCPQGDTLIIGGKPIHVVGYLEKFLFSSERAKTKVSVLSGGERNRVLLAKVFSKPANLLVLDEPTNDLDIETLELLEELIADFKETVLLICHDRTFLNNIVSSTLVFADNGEIKEIIGGYDEWLAERNIKIEEEKAKQVNEKNEVNLEKTKQNQKKLSYNEKRELEAIPAKIDELEKQINEIKIKLTDPFFYKTGENPHLLQAKADELEEKMLELFERQEILEAKA